MDTNRTKSTVEEGRRGWCMVVYPYVVARMLGISMRSSCEVLRRIRKKFGKPKRSAVSIRDYSEYTGIPEHTVDRFINF